MKNNYSVGKKGMENLIKAFFKTKKVVKKAGKNIEMVVSAVNSNKVLVRQHLQLHNFPLAWQKQCKSTALHSIRT